MGTRVTPWVNAHAPVMEWYLLGILVVLLIWFLLWLVKNFPPPRDEKPRHEARSRW
jgi:hypothetical protein